MKKESLRFQTLLTYNPECWTVGVRTKIDGQFHRLKGVGGGGFWKLFNHPTSSSDKVYWLLNCRSGNTASLLKIGPTWKQTRAVGQSSERTCNVANITPNCECEHLLQVLLITFIFKISFRDCPPKKNE